MPNRREVLQGCLLATISLSLPREVRAEAGEVTWKAEWEVLPAGRSSVNVRVALTPDQDTRIHLLGDTLPGFQVLEGGTLNRPSDRMSVSRAGPRRRPLALAAGETTKVGGWLVTPDAKTLKVALDLQHDGGQAHFEATLPVETSKA